MLVFSDRVFLSEEPEETGVVYYYISRVHENIIVRQLSIYDSQGTCFQIEAESHNDFEEKLDNLMDMIVKAKKGSSLVNISNEDN